MLASDDHRESVQAARDSVVDRFREALFTGFAVMIPILITLYVMSVAAGLIVDVLTPVEEALVSLEMTPYRATLLIRAVAVALLVGVTLLIGLFATFNTGKVVLQQFDTLIENIPGVGTVYKSFRQMGDVMLESDSGNFRDVKLVEFPHDGTYTLGFETTETPEPIQEAAGREDMRTLFLPLAPNPVMGGFLAHVPEGDIHDVDMTVEEGIRAVVTTGVGVAEPGGGDGEVLSPQELERLGDHQTTMTNPPDDESDDT